MKLNALVTRMVAIRLIAAGLLAVTTGACATLDAVEEPPPPPPPPAPAPPTVVVDPDPSPPVVEIPEPAPDSVEPAIEPMPEPEPQPPITHPVHELPTPVSPPVQPAPPPAPPPVTAELPPFDVTPDQLAQAIRARDWNRVTVLLAQGADPNALATDGNDALHLAVAEGDPNLVRLLLDDPRTDVDRRSRTGDTPLHVAAAEGHTGAITRILIEGGADENALDAQRRTPQQRAVAEGHGDEDDPPSDPAPFYPPMLIAGLLMFALVAVPEIVKPDPERRQSPFVRLWAVISVTVAAAGIPGMPSFLLVPASGAQVAGLTLDDGQINAGAAGVVFLGLTAVFFRNEVVDVLNAIANLIRGTDK